MKSLSPFLAALLFIVPAVAAEQPVEIGKVTWKRDFDAALKEAVETKKPVFLLFQEVPG